MHVTLLSSSCLGRSVERVTAGEAGRGCEHSQLHQGRRPELQTVGPGCVHGLGSGACPTGGPVVCLGYSSGLEIIFPLRLETLILQNSGWPLKHQSHSGSFSFWMSCISSSHARVIFPLASMSSDWVILAVPLGLCSVMVSGPRSSLRCADAHPLTPEKSCLGLPLGDLSPYVLFCFFFPPVGSLRVMCRFRSCSPVIDRLAVRLHLPLRHPPLTLPG